MFTGLLIEGDELLIFQFIKNWRILCHLVIYIPERDYQAERPKNEPILNGKIMYIIKNYDISHACDTILDNTMTNT